MAGSPKKRARREAERLRRAAEQRAATPAAVLPTSVTETECTAGSKSIGNQSLVQLPANNTPAVIPLKGEILPPEKAADQLELTRTALKRAMRKRAAEYAEQAIEVLARNLKSKDPDVSAKAANDILKWGFGNPVNEIEGGNGEALALTILRFRDPDNA